MLAKVLAAASALSFQVRNFTASDAQDEAIMVPVVQGCRRANDSRASSPRREQQVVEAEQGCTKGVISKGLAGTPDSPKCKQPRRALTSGFGKGHAADFQMRDPSIGRRVDELNVRGISFQASRALLASHDESGSDDGRLSLKRWNR